MNAPRTTLLAAAVIALIATNAGAVMHISCVAASAPPVAAPGRKIVASSYVSCAGVPASIKLCSKLQFAWRDARGAWHFEDRKSSCTTASKKSVAYKATTDKCVYGYYRTYNTAKLVGPPHTVPQEINLAGASPAVKIRCY